MVIEVELGVWSMGVEGLLTAQGRTGSHKEDADKNDRYRHNADSGY
jgi:hypothetical protein